uniref:AAA+ ATPase domain-containing protein n=1 Tax=Fagus sylvatica TaxID=28930 RepID=A0A2N9GMV8_FAGSY
MGFRKGSHDEILFQERPRLDYHLSPTGLVSMMVATSENLKVQFQKLGDKRKGLQLLIDVERRNGQEILPEVNSWVEKVDEISQALQRFIDEDVKANKMCLGGGCPDLKAKKNTLEIDAETRNDQVIASAIERWVQMVDNIREGLQSFIDEDKMCLNLKSRYSLSRKAKKKTLEIDGLLKEAEQPSFNKALRGDNINMISICGMGGIGKTTMAKEVAKRAKDDKLFDEVVMAVVSQNQDLRKIQGQIADMLRLKLEGETELGRANQLYSRLMRSKSVLVILDDVWEALNLEDIGIPYGGQHKRCKILLTSRSEEACNQMRSQKIVPIKVLSEEEAWNLFREMAGDCVDTPGLRPIAKEVAKECGALPVAIVTVGRALENKTKDEWIAALEQLKKSIPKNIPGLHSKSDMELDEGCLQRLIMWQKQEVESMQWIKDLKRSFLLLDSWKEECVKMHDVVRDVAISIAEEHGFLVGCDDKMEEWPEKDTYEIYVAISLFSREMKKHPDGLECSKLELLQLSCGKDTPQMLPANMFQGMKELKVLSMRGMSFPSLPQSIQVLQNLRTLHLEYCGLEDVSAIGALGKLEMLSFLGSKIKELPREIGNLGHLKLLDLSECSTLQRIPYGLLSSLSRLEELYMSNVPRYIMANSQERSFSGAQLACFGNLTSLHLDACYRLKNVFSLSIARGLVQLQELDITSCTDMEEIFSKEGQDEKAFDMIKFPQLKHVELYDVPRLIGFCTFVDPIELVQPSHAKGNATNFKSGEFQHEQHHTGSFPESGSISNKFLSSKTIFWSPNLGKLVMWGNDSLEVLFDLEGLMVQPQRIDVLAQLKTLRLRKLSKLMYVWKNFSRGILGFQNLTSIEVRPCPNLRYLFPPSIAKLLVELQSVNLQATDMMENIVQRDGEEEAADTIVFPKVSSFTLHNLPNLMSFCVEAYSFEWPSMKEIKIKSLLQIENIWFRNSEPKKAKENQGIGFKTPRAWSWVLLSTGFPWFSWAMP